MSDKPKSRRQPRAAGAKNAAPVLPEPPAGLERSALDDRSAIVERIVAGLFEGIPLRALCRQAGMPPAVTVHAWMEADPELAARIARARDKGFDAIAEDALVLADQPAETSVEVQQRRLAVETRLKLLAKWCPRRFGDKVEPEPAGRPDSNVRVLTEERRLELMERRRRALQEEEGE